MHFKLLLFISISILYGEENLSTIYMQKYLPNLAQEKQNARESQKHIEEFSLTAKDNIDSMLQYERNQTVQKERATQAKQYIPTIDKNSSYYQDATKISKALHSKKIQKKLDEMVQYIVYNKKIEIGNLEVNLSKASRKLFASPQDIIQRKKMFLCISSSMPKSLIQNYLKQIEQKYPQIELVLNGFIGGMRKIKPTLAFLNQVLDKGNGKRYAVKIQINPKIFMRYHVYRVPALVVDPYFDTQLTNNTLYTGSTDETFISIYGAFSLDAMIERAKEELQKMQNKRI